VVFLFVFSISAFFSFTYYYNNIFKLSSKKIVAELQPMELAADVILPTTNEIAARYDEASAKIIATPSFKAYLESLDALVDAGRNAGPALREAIQKGQEAQQQARLAAAAQATADLQDAQNALNQLDETKDKIAGLDRSIAGLDTIIKGKQDEISSLSTSMRQEEQESVDASKGLDRRGASCGTNCLTHRAKAEEMRRRIATIKETLGAPTNERTAFVRQRDALNAQTITLRQRADAAALAAKRAPPTIEAAPDIDGLVRALAQLRDQIRVNPSWRVVREARPLCEPVLAAARKSNAAPSIIATDFGCEPAGLDTRDLLASRDEIIAARASFDQKCALDGALRDEIGAIVAKIHAAQASDAGAAANGFAQAKKVVDACVVLGKTVGLSETDVRALLKKSDVFLRGHTSERNKFELAREAFLSFTPDSTMAICVAMAQDAFVFIMKFLSEIFKRGLEARERRQFSPPLDLTDVETEPTETRAMKAVIRAAKPVHGDMSEIDVEAPTIAVLPLSVRENVVALLNRLVRDEIAHVDRKRCYIVDNVTIAQVEQRIVASLRSRWSSRPRDARGDASEEGPRAYYGDMSGEVRRRRPSAVERYLTADHAPADALDSLRS
jgi:predicted  nucleic acid-binding Zn-ribbon protein